jgi:hypothetical protein
MPHINAASYVLTSQRVPPPVWVINYIRVAPVPFVGAGNGIQFVNIVYLPLPAATPAAIGGISSSPPNLPWVTAYFPAEDFDLHWRIFQTEAPVELSWKIAANAPPTLSTIAIRTALEPVGEGPTDKS